MNPSSNPAKPAGRSSSISLSQAAGQAVSKIPAASSAARKSRKKQAKKAGECLECEKRHIFLLLMFVGGYYGAFTFTVRGGVFCNAQTANFVLMSIALGSGLWLKAAYYLIPMSAYFLGSVISEALPGRIRKKHQIRWDTVLIGLEMVSVFVLGLIPDSWPFQITQVAVNFICAMQYNTFRMARGIPMATVFCTNHVRQLGIHFVKWVKHDHSKQEAERLQMHLSMLGTFILGAVFSTILAHHFGGKAIWFALLPLSFLFTDLLYADLALEKKDLSRIPAGH